MKKTLFSILTLVLGLVLSGSDCSGPDPIVDPGTTDAGVKIGDVTWATRNVGAFGKFAAKPEDAGMMYQWNRKTAYAATGNGTPSNWDASEPGNTWNPNNDPCPSGWKVPTEAQFTALIAAGSVFEPLNGVTGRKFGSGANTIFLPGVGMRMEDGTLVAVGSGYYWSSTEASTFVYVLNLGTPDIGSSLFKMAHTVRCVKK